jgi:hypothetical protein
MLHFSFPSAAGSACRLHTGPRMRILIVVALAGLSVGCTPKTYCESVALGQQVPPSAKPADRTDSWCGTHPARYYMGPENLADAGTELFSYGEFDPNGTEQCCLSVQDGGVVAKWVGYD